MKAEQVYISKKSFDNITLKEFLLEYANVKIQDNWSATADYYCHSEDSACGSTLYVLKESGVSLNIAENVYLEDYALHEALWEFLSGDNYNFNIEVDMILHLCEDILEELEDQWANDEAYKESLCQYFEVEIEEEEEEFLQKEFLQKETEYQDELEYQRKKELYKGVTQYNYKSFPNEHKARKDSNGNYLKD